MNDVIIKKNNKSKKNIIIILIVALLVLLTVAISLSLNYGENDIAVVEKNTNSKKVKVSFVSTKLISDKASNNVYQLNYNINPTDKKTYYSRIASYVNSKKIEYQKCQKVESGKNQKMDVKVPYNSKYKFLVNVYTSSNCSKNRVASVSSKTYSNIVDVSFADVKKIDTAISNYWHELSYKVTPQDKTTTYYSRVAGYVNSKLVVYEDCKKVESGKNQTLKLEIPSNSKYKFGVYVYTSKTCNQNRVLSKTSKTYISDEIYPQFENYNYLSIPLNEPKFYKGVTHEGTEKIVFDYYGTTTYYYKLTSKQYGEGDRLINSGISKCKKFAPTNNYSNLVLNLSVDNKVKKDEVIIDLYEDSSCKKRVKQSKDGVSTNYSNAFIYLYDKKSPEIITACRKKDGSVYVSATDDSMIVGFQLGINKNDYDKLGYIAKYILKKDFSLIVSNVSTDYKYLFVYDSVGNISVKKISTCPANIK